MTFVSVSVMTRVLRHARISRCLQDGHLSDIINGVITHAKHIQEAASLEDPWVNEWLRQRSEQSECYVNIFMRRTICSHNRPPLRKRYSTGRLLARPEGMRFVCSCLMILDDDPAAKGPADPTDERCRPPSTSRRTLTTIRATRREARQDDDASPPGRDGSSPELGESADDPSSERRCHAEPDDRSSKLSVSIFRRRRTG